MNESKETCWHCGKPLSLYKGLRSIFTEYKDPVGNMHRLHKCCYTDNYSEEKITAKARGENDPIQSQD